MVAYMCLQPLAAFQRCSWCYCNYYSTLHHANLETYSSLHVQGIMTMQGGGCWGYHGGGMHC